MTLSALLARSRRTRLVAVRELPASDALRDALRRVLFTDAHAEVRAAAARRLGQFAGVEGWLVEALDDASPLVRDAVLRALARAGTTTCAPRLRRIVETDPMWWVRRAAIYGLAAIAGAAELPAFTRALGDPFWRVRQAAVKVLAVLGAADPTLRDEIVASDATSAADASTLAFLRSSWGPVAIEAPQRAAVATSLPAALRDPDPAVVTARLAAGDFPAAALVELLCDPHVPLRVLAASRLARSRDRAALAAALDWLEEPRIPHVADTVHRLLDGLGELAAELATGALARADRRGAARWAIGWVVATCHDDLAPAALARAHADPELRRAAVRLASDAELGAWAAEASGDPQLVGAIAVELHERRRAGAHDVLLAIDGTDHPRVRALQLDVRARRGAWPEVERGLADPHHGPRAVAARWLARAPAGSAALANDPDPAVREAAVTADNAASVYLADADPWVRRAAIATLARAWHDRAGAPPLVGEATLAALADADPWIRAQACALSIEDDGALAHVLAQLADRDEMARAAAHDAMTRLATSDARVHALLAAQGPSDVPPIARAMAHAWLSRALDDDAIAAARAALEREDEPRVRAVLAGIAGVALPGATSAVDSGTRPAVAGHDADTAPSIERRAFGRAGFDVAPLAISGAYDVSASGLAEAAAAGVDLYFWEPGYEVLAKFLRVRARRERLRVITGTYHADAASIRADVDRALRKLRRETLDAFLLFWTRSPARVDDEAFAVLDDLRRAGKLRAIGFSTHHRELAREAIEQRPWDVVMIRHSAAHPGIETALLPVARERGTAIVTFSALCYGRMLSGPGAPTAAECYRYSLSQPGVTACISAPRRYRELVENLGVLAEPMLSTERVAALREHGRAVHAESARFNALLRQPTRDAAAAAREMLAAELPPEEAQPTRRALPRPSEAKRSRTRLGTVRRAR